MRLLKKCLKQWHNFIKELELLKMYMEKVKNAQFWKDVRTNEKYSPIINRVKKLYQQNRQESIPAIKYSDRFIFYKTGSRIESEDTYFKRRAFLSSAVVLSLIYSEEEKYLTEIQDMIWAICDEYSWALPAHTPGKVDEDNNVVDLFDSETGAMLCEICYIMGDRLDENIHLRVSKEVTKRVIEPYENNTYWWEKGNNNWASVCAGSVGTCLMHIDSEKFNKNLPNLLKTMQCFIDGYPDDGTCLEGFGYWMFGFGHYIWFADMLLDFTDGKINLFDDPKVAKIAEYAQHNFLIGNSNVSFSDGYRSLNADYGIIYQLHSQYPDTVNLLPMNRMKIRTGAIAWFCVIRAFLFFDPNAENIAIEKKDYFLPDAQQFIANRENYSLAAKGGHNNEQHNHNDVGNFIFADKDGQAICDLGAGLYTKQYFSTERYNILCNSSLGHSVPIIDGNAQKAKRECEGSLKYENETVTIEMAKAYGLENLRSLERKILLKENGIVLKDSFDTDAGKISERFISTRKPEISKNTVSIGKTTLHFDESLCDVSYKTEIHFLNEGEIKREERETSSETVYCIDFNLKKGVKDFTVNITADKQ